MKAYTNPSDATNPHRLPDIEVFYADGTVAFPGPDGEALPIGFYWWACFPGCLPDSEPMGPFDTAEDAVEDAQSAAFDSFT